MADVLLPLPPLERRAHFLLQQRREHEDRATWVLSARQAKDIWYAVLNIMSYFLGTTGQYVSGLGVANCFVVVLFSKLAS